MAEGGPPDINEQKQQISSLLQKSLVKGEAWYLIDIKWMEQWKKYVGFDSLDECSASNDDLHPGPIDNSGILKDDDPTQLKDSLIDELDYVLLPQDEWEKISSWYGCAEGQEPITRKVVERGMYVKSCWVEVYLTEFNLCENNKLDHIVKAKFSKGDTIDTIERKMRELFNISEDKETRLWNKYMSNSYEPLHERKKTVVDAELYQGQLLVIEQKNDDGSWSRQLPAESTYTCRSSNDVENLDSEQSPDLVSLQEALKIYYGEEMSRSDGNTINTEAAKLYEKVETAKQQEKKARENGSKEGDDRNVSALTLIEEIESSQLEETEKKQLISDVLMTCLDMAQTSVDSVFALREEHKLTECIEAVKSVGGNLQRAWDFFKECATCFTSFGMHKLVSLPTCQCLVCTECFTEHFTTLTQTTSCMYKFACTVCAKPDLENCPSEEFQTYFSYLGEIMKNYLKRKDCELYEQKLAMWELMGDQNFRWCVNGCLSGFINERGDRKVQCPECLQYQCFKCKKPWSDQHSDASCGEVNAWTKASDPEIQQQGHIAHLQENGIDCPKCKMHYEVAKGGCMHFKCPQCHHEFCCGCNLPFRSYPGCQQLPSCKSKGLHAHHPRDCLYYLRDEECQALQRLLQIHNVNFIQTTNAAVAGHGEGPVKCPVKEQHDGPIGLKDAICGKPIKDQCGLCDKHYKEYLVGLINQGNIDPVDIFDLKSLQNTLRRDDKKIPDQKGNETEASYCARLRQEVQQQLPLTPRNAQGVQGVTVANRA